MSRDVASPEAGQRSLESYLLYLGIAAVVGLVLMLGLSIGWPSGSTPTGPGESGKKGPDNQLELARQALARDTDVNTCRSALQLLNDYFQQDATRRPPQRPVEEREQLQKLFGLDPGELGELESTSFTLLDGAYLESCSVFRDAARSLDIVGAVGPEGKQLALAPLDRVSAALAWTVRQVRIGPGGPLYIQQAPNFPAPPLFTARRGRGTDLERSLVFLALLNQLDRPEERVIGCLVYLPQPRTLVRRLWACAVLVGKSDDIYLFDTRLGLPIPGPGGKGIATLAQVCKDNAILRQLDSPDLPYDVDAELAGQAELKIVAPLSGLSPRMTWLQTAIRTSAQRVNLATPTLEDLQRIKSAASLVEGKTLKVSDWKEIQADGKELSGPSLLRRFLPRAEGGIGTDRRDYFILDLVPWGAMPAQCQDPVKFPRNIQLGKAVSDYFASPFLKTTLQPSQARDMILRGRIDMATPELTKDLQQVQDYEQRQLPPDLTERVDRWASQARDAYSKLFRLEGQAKADPTLVQEARGEVDKLWREPAVPLILLLQSGLAKPRGAELTYQLAICTLQRAESIQARIDLLQRTPGAKLRDDDLANAKSAWQDALGWWTRYCEEYPDGPAQAQARRMRARAEWMKANALAALKQDEKEVESLRKQAVESLKFSDKNMTGNEKLAAGYLARQMGK